jgi:dTDP-4-dehydrorhamnose 3,5-epimerase-like enzyme
MVERALRRATEEEQRRACFVAGVPFDEVLEAWVDDSGQIQLVKRCAIERVVTSIHFPGGAMTENERYTGQVERGEYPDWPEVPKGSSFIDDRGEISNLLFAPVASVARIRSKKGTVRANHLHVTDWHYAFVESGRVLYFERPAGSPSIPEGCEFGPGEMFFTRPGVEHAMLFLEHTVIFTFSRNVRTHDNHEADLHRVAFITPQIAAEHVSRYDAAMAAAQ